MAKTTLQLRRGTQAENSTFIGANGEVVVDTTRKTLVVHDGSTAGGSALATLASPAFSGTPTAPTASPGDNTTKLATTAFVTAAISGFGAGPANTDALAEGTTNLYFTKDRVYGALAAGGNISLVQNPTTKITTISYTQPTNVSAFTNDAGYLTSANIRNSISVVDASGQLTYDPNTGVFTFTQTVASVNGLTGVVVLNSDNISDVGRTNKWASSSTVRGYFTSGTGINYTSASGTIALANTSITLGGKTISLTSGSNQAYTTDDLTEGSTNKYFSTTLARGAFSQGTGVTITSGQIAIGQAVGTSDSPTFQTITANVNLNVGTNLIKTDNANARVAINKASPSYTLDVSGDVNLTGKLRVSGDAGTSNYVLVSGGSTASPSWASISSALPDIIEIDKFSYRKDGATVKFNLTSNGTSIYVSYPAQLLVAKNGIVQQPWLNKSGPVWQPLTPFGDYTVDPIDGDIVFSSPPQLQDVYNIRVLVGNMSNPVVTTYPFRAIDIMIGT